MLEKMLFDALHLIGGASLFILTGYTIAAIALYINPGNMQ